MIEDDVRNGHEVGDLFISDTFIIFVMTSIITETDGDVFKVKRFNRVFNTIQDEVGHFGFAKCVFKRFRADE